MSLNIFLIYNIYFLCCLCIDFYYLSALCDCWFVVYMRRFIYKCPFDNTAVAGRRKVGPVNQLIKKLVTVVNPLTVLSRSAIAV